MRPLLKKEIKKLFKEYKQNIDFVLIIENMQYARNVAELFRVADALKVRKVYLTGISQKPPFGKDLQKVSRTKEEHVQWEYIEKSHNLLNKLKKDGFKVLALELTDSSIPVDQYKTNGLLEKYAIVVGNEVYGVTKDTLGYCDESVHLPMYGKGASLNVTVSLGILLYLLSIDFK
jgi:23S rRNA (guanosine2251-2'-O)-methyltransferase